MDQGITIYDQDLRLVAWNNRYYEMDIESAENMHYGAYLFDLYVNLAKKGIFGSGDPNELAERHIEAIRNGPLIEYELLTPPSGKLIQIHRFRLPNGGICATFTDVTKEVRKEEQLRQSAKMDALGRLTGGVAHDFNNILAVVIGNLKLALNEIEDKELLRYINHSLDAANRGAKLTDRLLAFARKQPLSPEKTNLATLLSSLHAMLQQLMGEEIDIELNCDPEIWLCEVDRNQLENVIVNLVVNARDAMSEGGKLIIEVSNNIVGADARELESGQYVRISVIDNGAGMEKEIVEKAFDPFFTTKETGRGTGLGLSMAHGFVKQSGGQIKISSVAGRGTAVNIYLPRLDKGSTNS